ncbi:UDP-glucose 4-epimerase [Modestobacter sp. DSM 44400]|uniref:NAD-dependent epimerase/dehydratase family protein n=1 Tax=Modestobacter sp. DSM 44400 TaxID=1550230 RepID=UPI000899BD2E|nr:NAD-dependent epimerase/dehydratase family protein [Modestobacter sp. DSM 44400]SDY49769.1 UDP-glucose 4-epimerase [Modestobacter sp. DSM 44400]
MAGTGMWVVTGGAGYVGGHVVAALHAAGVELVVLDDLSTGRADRLPPEVRLVRGRVGNRAVLDGVLDGAAGVVHLAALTSAPESVDSPLAYYRANVTDVATLLGAMTDHRVPNLVASSSAAVYGGRPRDPAPAAFPENHRPRPQNPYGTTKLVGEHLMSEAGGAAGIATVALRYFNVVGAGARELADSRPGGLLPRVLAARRDGVHLVVNGRTHPTPDGSAVRDFVHAADVASAHVAAVSRLSSGGRGAAVYNVGTGRGASVLDVLARTEAVTGGPVPWVDGPPRVGDASCAVADTSLIARELGWHAERDLDESIASAWAAMTSSAPVTTPRRRLARAG